MKSGFVFFVSLCALAGVGSFLAVYLMGLDILERLCPGKSLINLFVFPGHVERSLVLYLDKCDAATRAEIVKIQNKRVFLARFGASAFAAIVAAIILVSVLRIEMR